MSTHLSIILFFTNLRVSVGMNKHSIQIIPLHIVWKWTPKSTNVVICIWRNYKDKERIIIIKGDFGVALIIFSGKKLRDDCKIKKNVKIENERDLVFSRERKKWRFFISLKWLSMSRYKGHEKKFHFKHSRISISILLCSFTGLFHL